MSMTPLVKCEFCEGSGERELPKELQASYLMLKRMGTVTIAEFSEKNKLELTSAHHRIKRLMKLGVVKRMRKAMPATYRVV